jgi:parvulin-like peptidyl-prolyl isomerase
LGDFFSGGGCDGRVRDWTFGYYDKEPITFIPGNFFSQNHDHWERMFKAQGIDINNPWTAAQIWRRAYEGAITHTAILQIMKNSNYSVPDRVVNREMVRRPEFQEFGRFSQTLYRQFPEYRRQSIWRQEQENLTRMMYFSDFGSLLTFDGESAFIANMSTPIRSFEMVSFRVDDYPDSEYLSYARENTMLFNSIHLSKITVVSEREANSVLTSIRNGSTTFEDAARNHSQDFYRDNGGDMGNIFFFELGREIPNSSNRESVFNLRKGELSDVIATVDGWGIFRAENDLIQADFEDHVVMDRVRSYIRNFQRGRMEDWAIGQAREFISEVIEFGFEDAARWRNLDRQSFGPLPINFGSVELFTALESFSITGFTSQDLSSLSRNENFWKTAFSTEVNIPSQPLVQGNNVLVFLPIEETETDELDIENFKMMFSWWLDSNSIQLMQQYFLNSSKTEDHFWDFYINFLM